MRDKGVNVLFVGGEEHEIKCAIDGFVAITKKNIKHYVATDTKVVNSVKYLDAVVCHREKDIRAFAAMIPALRAKFPDLLLPTPDSLYASTDKFLMRQAFAKSSISISPKFTIIDQNNIDAEALRLGREFSKQIIIKPAHNASSMYVSLVDNEASSIESAVTKIVLGYERNKHQEPPLIVAEEYLIGPMCTIDAYVDNSGNCTFCPPVKVLTGKDIGHEDFYGFCRIAPTQMSAETRLEMEKVVEEGVGCLNLRNSSAHAELRLTAQGWKLIEIGPRIGGYRDLMYKEVFGFNHAANDLLNRLSGTVSVNNKAKCHIAVLKLYPKKSGRLKEISGLEKFMLEAPGVSILKQKNIGAKVRLASEGGFEAAMVVIKSDDFTDLDSKVNKIIREVFVEIEPFS